MASERTAALDLGSLAAIAQSAGVVVCLRQAVFCGPAAVRGVPRAAPPHPIRSRSRAASHRANADVAVWFFRGVPRKNHATLRFPRSATPTHAPRPLAEYRESRVRDPREEEAANFGPRFAREQRLADFRASSRAIKRSLEGGRARIAAADKSAAVTAAGQPRAQRSRRPSRPRAARGLA